MAIPGELLPNCLNKVAKRDLARVCKLRVIKLRVLLFSVGTGLFSLTSQDSLGDDPKVQRAPVC